MNPLVANEKTGFLESEGGINAFTSERKVMFLEACRKYREEHNGKWPDFSNICENLGITNTTLDRHLKQDEVFREKFRDLTLSAKYKLESNLYDLGQKKGFEALIWLRRFFPEEYNPEYKAPSNLNIQVFVDGTQQARQIVDGEVVNTGTHQALDGPQ